MNKTLRLRILFTLILFVTTCTIALGQYYLRGEVRDEQQHPIANARMLLHSTGYLYYSGTAGDFGITSQRATDSVTITVEGYIPATFEIRSGTFSRFVLKALPLSTMVKKDQLKSLTKDLKFDENLRWTVGGETYSSLVENQFIPAKTYPETSFAIHTDKASYSNIRRFLNMKTRVPPDAVRAEEMLNYFNFGYTPPVADSLFGFNVHISDCPWNEKNRLLYFQVCSRQLPDDSIPPSNLVFLIDVSGSMDMPNRLPLLKSSFKLLVENLRATDTISIVVYGSAVGIWLPPTSGTEKEKIRNAIEDLNPGGATAGASGILTAYELAKRQYIPNGNNRVILATDGDFNIGQTSDKDLENLITLHQQSGIYLTCLGVGMGNYKDSKLEVLAKRGNGNFAYLDNEREAEKVLVTELTQTLFTVADDAYLNFRFNPAVINEYRLIGYDNKLQALSDTLSRIEGGEVGPGHTMMVLVEYSPSHEMVNSKNLSGSLADVQVYFRLPGDSVQRSSHFNIPDIYTAPDKLPADIRFATAVVMFAGMLKESKAFKSMQWNDVQSMASKAHDPANVLQVEMVSLINEAKRIYSRKKGRRP